MWPVEFEYLLAGFEFMRALDLLHLADGRDSDLVHLLWRLIRSSLAIDLTSLTSLRPFTAFVLPHGEIDLQQTSAIKPGILNTALTHRSEQ